MVTFLLTCISGFVLLIEKTGYFDSKCKTEGEHTALHRYDIKKGECKRVLSASLFSST